MSQTQGCHLQAGALAPNLEDHIMYDMVEAAYAFIIYHVIPPSL